MATTIEEGFNLFIKRLTPLKTETDAAKSHRASIEKCLKRNFSMTNFFRSGSFGNGTSIRKYSDVDYFAVIPRERLRQDSLFILNRIKSKLNYRFQSTDVKIRIPAVFIPFGSLKCESTEIVPADFLGNNKDGFEIFDIPNFNNLWIKSSPKAHNKFVTTVDEKLDNKVRPLIRFFKAWKYIRQVPISSFYLELLITNYCLNESSIVYNIDIQNILDLLYRNNLPTIEDPLEIADHIQPCSSSIAKKKALNKIKLYLPIIEKANMFENGERIGLSFKYLRRFYNGKFPTYG